jgi:hypothetical protein
MTEGTGEQDLVKALDNVAGDAPSSNPYTPSDTQLGAGAVASPFPPIIAQTPPPPLPSQPPDSETPPYLTPDFAQPPVPSSPLGSLSTVVTEDTGPLAAIKQDALVELRPLVDKLNVSPEEKFDTYLLLIRSTDDTNLIGPAHDAAKLITDETRRAEALLDIIKEIDYLSHPKTDA